MTAADDVDELAQALADAYGVDAEAMHEDAQILALHLNQGEHKVTALPVDRERRYTTAVFRADNHLFGVPEADMGHSPMPELIGIVTQEQTPTPYVWQDDEGGVHVAGIRDIDVARAHATEHIRDDDATCVPDLTKDPQRWHALPIAHESDDCDWYPEAAPEMADSTPVISWT